MVGLLNNTYTGFLNMDHRIDRLNHVTEQFKKTNLLTPNRHRGKKPQEYNLDDPKYKVMLNRTPGAIACHEGQVAIMKMAQSVGSNAVVFEDDVILCEDFDKRLVYIDNWTKTHEWDVIWLGASFHVNPCYWHPIGQSGMRPDCSAQLGKDCEPTDDPRMIRTYGAYVTFAYIVNVESMDKIFKLFDEHLHTSIGIDWLFIKLQPQLKCFSFVPGCVMQMDNMSDIGSGMTVWSGQLNNGPYVFQNKMEDFSPETFAWS